MWTEQDNALCRSFRFADFKTAFAFLTDVAAEAERLDHHPWFSNEYDRVEFRLRSHDAGNTVTKRDHRLAEAIDAAAGRHGALGTE
jgi:4a-hydroxytetrahydrobiopterin dehydratase